MIDRRSPAFDRLIASKLRRDTTLRTNAQANLARRLQTASPSAKPTLLEWHALLEGPLESLFQTLKGTEEPSTRLRQSSPFCGILTREECTRILQAYHTRESLLA